MTCGCNECPDCKEEYTGNVSIAGECGGCKDDCGKKKECCNPNIVGGNCISVDTSEEGVITISTECNPEIISSDGTVDVTKTHTDIDIWDLSVKDKNNYVGACDNDKNPSTLDQKLEGVNGITITPICSDNGKIQIGFDHSTIQCDDKKVAVAAGCTPDYLGKLIEVQSNRLEKDISGCKVIIKDKETDVYYAKMVLNQNRTNTITLRDTGWDLALNGGWNWKPVSESYSSDIQASFNKNCKITSYGGIEIRKKGLYHVGFSGSMEISFGIHAFRMQLYRYIGNNNPKTILESRYSGPLGRPLWMERFGNQGLIKVPTEIDEETGLPTEYRDYKLDFPIVGDITEAEGIVTQGPYSQSMGAVLDRVPVNGGTIVELDVGDVIFPGIKISTEVKTAGMFEDGVAQSSLIAGHITLLGSGQEDGDNGSECGFSYFVDLIHPLVI